MKSLIIGDLHIGNNKDNPIFHKISLEFADWVKQQMIERKLDHIIQCGDIYHNRSSITLPSMNCAYRFFNRLEDFNINIITGNHDCYYLENSTIHGLDFLKGWSNITIHDKPLLRDNIFYAPWGTKVEEFESAKVLIGHLEFNGYEMSKGKICEKGLNAAELIKKYSLILSGHFHKPQGRKYGSSILLYTGSCFQLNWGEEGEDKYVYVLDHETLKLEKIKNTVSPRFEYIKSEKDYDKIKNNFVSIDVIGDEEREKALSLLGSYNPIRIDTKLVYVSREKNETLDTYKSSLDVDEIIVTYVNDVFKDFTDEEKNNLIKMYQAFYNELKE